MARSSDHSWRAIKTALFVSLTNNRSCTSKLINIEINIDLDVQFMSNPSEGFLFLSFFKATPPSIVATLFPATKCEWDLKLSLLELNDLLLKQFE